MSESKQPAPASGAVKYVTAAHMIDCTGAAASNNPVIVVKDSRIDKVGSKDSIKIPQGAEVIDCGNCTLIPGMMDIHLHTMMFNCLTFHNHRVAQWEITPELQQMYGLFHAQLCFDMGFTTLRDLGPQFAVRAAGERSLRHPRRHRRRHRGRPAHAGGGVYHHHRLASGADPAARGGAARLSDRRRALGAAQAGAHQPAGGRRCDQDLRHRRRRHRQGGARHPQHDAGGVRRRGRRGARLPQALRRALLHAAGPAHGAEGRRRHHRAHGVLRRRDARHDQGGRRVDDADAGAPHRSRHRESASKSAPPSSSPTR